MFSADQIVTLAQRVSYHELVAMANMIRPVRQQTTACTWSSMRIHDVCQEPANGVQDAVTDVNEIRTFPFVQLVEYACSSCFLCIVLFSADLSGCVRFESA